MEPAAWAGAVDMATTRRITAAKNDRILKAVLPRSFRLPVRVSGVSSRRLPTGSLVACIPCAFPMSVPFRLCVWEGSVRRRSCMQAAKRPQSFARGRSKPCTPDEGCRGGQPAPSREVPARPASSPRAPAPPRPRARPGSALGPSTQSDPSASARRGVASQLRPALLQGLRRKAESRRGGNETFPSRCYGSRFRSFSSAFTSSIL